jgi:O-antigen/teichoic acid export membrane protein
MVTTMQILTLIGPLQAVTTTVGWIYQASGRSDLYFRVGSGAAVAIVAAILFGVHLGSIVAVAACYAVMTAGVLLVPTVSIPGRLIGVRFRDVARVVALPFLAGSALVLAVGATDRLVLDSSGPWVRLLVGSGLGAVVYFGLLTWFRCSALSYVLAALRSRSSRRQASATLL